MHFLGAYKQETVLIKYSLEENPIIIGNMRGNIEMPLYESELN
jgi:hypothetical protein